MTMREAAGPTTSAAPSAGTPSRGARLLGRAAATFTRHGWRDERRPGTGLDPAPDEPVAGMGWHQVGSSHVAGAADGCYEVRCVRDLRWEDDSMGANFLYDWGSINQDFAAGQIGMYVSGGGNYGNLFTQNAMNPDDYGLTVIPLVDDGGVLGGGTLAAVSAKASPEEQAAGVEWIDFYYMQKLADEDAAKLDAETAAANDQPVGAPELPVFDEQTYLESRTWIADYVNVPVDQMSSYTENIFDQPVVPEPARSTQEIYALLDPVVQAVLTDEDADIDALVAQVQKEAQALLDAAQG